MTRNYKLWSNRQSYAATWRIQRSNTAFCQISTLIAVTCCISRVGLHVFECNELETILNNTAP